MDSMAESGKHMPKSIGHLTTPGTNSYLCSSKLRPSVASILCPAAFWGPEAEAGHMPAYASADAVCFLLPGSEKDD